MNQKETAQLTRVMNESLAILDSDVLLRTPVKDLPADTQATVWSVLDVIKKTVVEERQKELREELLAYANTHGEKDKKSKVVVFPDGTKVSRQEAAGKMTIDAEEALKMTCEGHSALGAAVMQSVSFNDTEFELLHNILHNLVEASRLPKELREMVPEANNLLVKLGESKLSVDGKILGGLVQASLVSAADLKRFTVEAPKTLKLVVKKSDAVASLEARAKKG